MRISLNLTSSMSIFSRASLTSLIEVRLLGSRELSKVEELFLLDPSEGGVTDVRAERGILLSV